MKRTRRPNRLHLLHHVFDVLPADRWYSAWEVAELLYHDRRGFHRQQKARVGEVLDLYARTPLMETDDQSAACRLYRRCDITSPIPERYHSELADLQRHAIQPMVHDDLWTLDEMRKLAPRIGQPDPACGRWDATGQPWATEIPEPEMGLLRPTGEAAKVRLCPAGMAKILRYQAGNDLVKTARSSDS